MSNKSLLLEALGSIEPSLLSYGEWLNVGMALHEEGFCCEDWEDWSSQDTSRYHPDECKAKWASFSHNNNAPIKGGTIIHYAKEQGWSPSSGHQLDWNDTITSFSYNSSAPANHVNELITYLETLFNADDYVGYVTQSYYSNGRYAPTKGCYDRTAGEVIEKLIQTNDIECALGSYDKSAGAWIRFNPLDGKGVSNDNVVSFKYALVESDNLPIKVQETLIRNLHLPVAALVSSGGKSLHAIVKVDAATRTEYDERVQKLYSICEDEGLTLDKQNKNPSRLSRMPGITRDGNLQHLIGTNLGEASWLAWTEWLSKRELELPSIENLLIMQNNPPVLAPELISGVLRQGHKMLLAGSSKAGKSYLLIELCIAIAEGAKWLQWQCSQGKVLYVNLELDRASCYDRFIEVYNRKGISTSNISNIDIWNLRGKAIPMDKIAPVLIERATDAGYIAVVVDPIYKCITGDENSASEMAHFTNQFDKVCNALGCSVIYAHHHSKGKQGSKRSMDRASGSGVFARDSDALLDMIQLSMDGNILDEAKSIYSISDDEASRLTAWRIEGTLREFAPFQPLDIFFNYPIHIVDDSDLLVAASTHISPSSISTATKNARAMQRQKHLDKAFDAISSSGTVTTAGLASELDVSTRTVLRYLSESEKYTNDNGVISRI
ncbi:MAG: AAA family ATPase [Mogibacterium sp.]|nr:AAA family ATPase [Mogibacterium sp.]